MTTNVIQVFSGTEEVLRIHGQEWLAWNLAATMPEHIFFCWDYGSPYAHPRTDASRRAHAWLAERGLR